LIDGKSKFPVSLVKLPAFYNYLKFEVTVVDSFSQENVTKEVPLNFFTEEYFVKDNTKEFVNGQNNHFEVLERFRL